MPSKQKGRNKTSVGLVKTRRRTKQPKSRRRDNKAMCSARWRIQPRGNTIKDQTQWSACHSETIKLGMKAQPEQE